MDNFVVKDYIEEITAAAALEIAQKPSTQAGQDLELYINNFERALLETQRLKEAVEGRARETKGAFCAEAGHLYRDAAALMTAFERASSIFGVLERRLDQAGNVAVNTGQQIDRLHHEKRRAVEAREILQAFMDFRTDAAASGRLEAVLLAGGTGEIRVKGAQALRRLLVLAGQPLTGAEGAAAAVHALAQQAENSLLAAFHEAFEEGDIDGMRQAAAVLIALNGGQSCIQSFVNQHDFFLSPIAPEAVITKYHAMHLDARHGPVLIAFGAAEAVDEALGKMFRQIVETAEEDWKYLMEVFERPWVVMDALLRRIFHEPVQVYLEEALAQARRHSLQAYLRSLYATYVASQALIAAVCRIYERYSGSSDLQAATLEALVAGLFSPYLEPRGYLQVEVLAATDALQLAKAPLLQALRARRAQAKSMSSFLRVGPATPAKADDIAKALATASLYRFGQGEPLVSAAEGQDGIPAPEVVARCLVLHAEATTRLFTLLPEHDRIPAIEQLFVLYLQSLVKDYIEAPVDAVLETGEFGADSRAGFDLLNVRLAANASKILSDIQIYFQTSLLPVAVALSATCYRTLVQAKSEMFAAVATKIDALLHKEIAGNLDWIRDSLLSKQKKTDFPPKTDELNILAGCSPTCQGVCDFLRTISRHVLGLMDASNAVLYLAALGTRFHSLLIEHIRKFSISDSGALLLRNDLRMYKEVIEGMGPAGKALRDSFELVCEIGNVFLVRPENLRSLLQEGFLAQLDSRLALQFIGQRADFRSAKIDQLFPEIQVSALAAFFAAGGADFQ